MSPYRRRQAWRSLWRGLHCIAVSLGIFCVFLAGHFSIKWLLGL